MDFVMAEDIKNFEYESLLNREIFNIITIIKDDHDFESAVEIIKQKKLTLEEITSRTIRLPLVDFIQLADLMISKKGK